MDTVILLQLVFIFVIFVLCFICVILPLKLIPQNVEQKTNKKSAKIISFCNCFSGGVFLGTCFLQLIPFIEDKFMQVFHTAGISLHYTCPVSQVTICLGFFLILFIEQLVRVCQHKDPPLTDTVEMLKVPADVPGASSTDGENSDDDGPDTISESQYMLRKQKHRSNSSAMLQTSADVHPNTNSHQNDHNASHHGHSHQGHGHSHLTDIVKDNFGLRCLMLLLALSIHSLFEGVALGLQDEIYKTVTLFIGIAVHEILVSFAIGVNLAQQKLKVATVIKLCIVFSLTIPVGIGLGMAMKGITNQAGQILSATVQGLTAGTFVYVTFLEILPAEINEPENRLLKVLFLFLGFAVISCLKFGIKDNEDDTIIYKPTLSG